MASSTMIVSGADSAHFKAVRRRTARPLAFPDGKTRLIALEARYWQVFDWLIAERNWPETDIPSLALDGTLRFHSGDTPDFEELLLWSIRFLLRLHMPSTMKNQGEWEAANEDNLVPP